MSATVIRSAVYMAQGLRDVTDPKKTLGRQGDLAGAVKPQAQRLRDVHGIQSTHDPPVWFGTVVFTMDRSMNSCITNPNDVFVTGIGLVTPLGMGRKENWRNLLAGKSGIRHITLFDARDLPVRIAGQLQDDIEYAARPFFKRSALYRTASRFSKVAVTAAGLALEDAGLSIDVKTREETTRIGISLGTSAGGLLGITEEVSGQCGVPRNRLATSLLKLAPNAAAADIATNFNINGPSLTLSTSCASGAHALGVAHDLIDMGRLDFALAGGVETVISKSSISGFDALGVLSRKNDAPEKASRPFDADRDGFVLSEGGGIIVLESRRHLEARGGIPYCRIRGWASLTEACTMINCVETGYGMAEVMRQALRNAGHEPSEVDYINAHGTSTRTNDICETRAIKMVFGRKAPRIPISSTKSMLGHCLGASAAIGAAVSALCISESTIPPTINLDVPDPECDLDYIPNVARSAPVGVAICNSFGIGGANCCVVMSR